MQGREGREREGERRRVNVRLKQSENTRIFLKVTIDIISGILIYGAKRNQTDKKNTQVFGQLS